MPRTYRGPAGRPSPGRPGSEKVLLVEGEEGGWMRLWNPAGEELGGKGPGGRSKGVEPVLPKPPPGLFRGELPPRDQDTRTFPGPCPEENPPLVSWAPCSSTPSFPWKAPLIDAAAPRPGRGGGTGSPSSSEPLLAVVFMCNHCPYVKGPHPGARGLRRRGTGEGWPSWASTPTTTRSTPEDWPREDGGALRRGARHLLFPYLLDESQEVGQGLPGPAHPRGLPL